MSNSEFNGMDFEALRKMSENAGKMVEAEMQRFDLIYEEMKKKLPEDEVGKLEAAKAKFNQAINLAKQGRQDEAQAIINNFTNGS